jgi:hypothetical protein
MAVTVDVRIDRRALNTMLSGPNAAAVNAVRLHGNRVLNKAIELCPVDEGRLRASLTLEMRQIGGQPVARVGSNLDYALFVHEGTGIYGPSGRRIRPVRATVLRWPVRNNSGSGRRRYQGGRTAQYAYAKSVAGMPGRPFLRTALRLARR